MSSLFFDDENINDFDYTYLKKIVHLDPTREYKKLIRFVEAELHLFGAFFSNMDYESAKFLLDYAKENNMRMYTSPERRLFFITKTNPGVSERLFEDLGYTKDIDLLVSNIDSAHFNVIISRFRDKIPFSDEEIKEARKKFIERVFEDTDLYYDLLDDSVRIVDSSNYIDPDSNEYIYDALESRESRRCVVNNVYGDLFSEYIFGDRFKNVVNEIDLLLSYARKEGKNADLLSIDILNDVCLGVSAGFHRIKRLFSDMKDNDLKKIKDFLTEKYKCETYKSLVSGCTDFTNELDCFDAVKSKQNGCDVYYLDGQDFNAFVRSDVEIDKSKIASSDVKIGRLSNSFTYIGKKNVQTYKDPNEYLTMIYTGVTEDNIGHVYHNDSFSSSSGSFTISEFYTAESLLERSDDYPEVWLKNYGNLKPFAILCFDEATDWDYDVARANGLSVVILNTNEYERKNGNARIGTQRI